jgi:hypothetical protein
MLTALEQHFLVRHVYVPSAAHWLDGDHDSMQGGSGPGRAHWMTDSKGVNYTMPDEKRPEWTTNFREAHKLMWAAIRDHMAHQPASLVTELHDALAASSAEARRHWDAMTAINKSWYSDATDEQRAALNAEGERSYAAERIIRARVRAVVLALLPLHDAWPDEEPADLIEWAERLS